jgi:uncharacterized protein
MLFIAFFEDKPEGGAIRREQMGAHLAYLDSNAAIIRVAGSLRVTPEASPIGGCWIIEAPDKAAVEELCYADPFWRAGLRSKLTILYWSKAFEDRQASI